MKTLILASAAFLALCLGLERLLHARAHDFAPRVERLLTLPQGPSVAALSLSGAEFGGELLYLRAKGLWRSRDAFGAICDEDQVEALLSACAQARGEELTRDPRREERYGLGRAERLTISFHGPKLLEREDRDRLAGLELGHACARRIGEPAILTIDRDPRALLVRPAPDLPPLVDTRLLAGCFAPGFAGFRRIAFEYRDGRSFALESQPAAGEAPPQWTLVQGEQRADALLERAGGFASLLVRARALGFGGPKQSAAQGLESPFLRLSLMPSAGETIELSLSERSPAHEAWLWNRKTNVRMRIDSEIAAQLAPEAADFSDSARPNPW